MGELSVGQTLGEKNPVAGGVVVDFGETAGWRESAYWVPMGGGTLVTCDAIQNCVDVGGASFLGRIMTNLMGFKGGVIVPPADLVERVVDAGDELGWPCLLRTGYYPTECDWENACQGPDWVASHVVKLIKDECEDIFGDRPAGS